MVSGTAVDGCAHTDGIDALAADLGPSFPHGVFVCQDDSNSTPGNSGNQNFKLVPLERVVGLSTAPPVNQHPNAVLGVQCTNLTCTVNGSGSADTDGSIASYAWDFGDGGTGSGVTTTHTYGSAGTRTITLTVTDDDGATGQATRSVTVPTATAAISFVGRTMSNVNATTHQVAVPDTVNAGDGLLLFFSSNSTAAVSGPTGLTGWQLLDTIGTSSSTTRVWRRVAGAGDAGAVVRVGVAAISKANLVLAAYRGTSATDPVATFARAAETVSRTTHLTPTAQVTGSGGWALSYWTHKDSTSAELAAPAGLTTRATGTQTGAGRVAGLLADTAAPVGLGGYGGQTATATAASPTATMWTIVLAPSSTAPPVNQPPDAVLGVQCTGLTCTVNGTGSTDADGTVASYAWSFGDGGTGSGVTTTHTYASAGTRTITLTVTDDDGATDQSTQSVTVAPQGSRISFVGRTQSTVNATSHQVAVPAGVVPGDGLLLFVSSNSTATVSEPAGLTGWVPLDTVTVSGTVTRVWRRVAGAGSAGAVVRVNVATISKVNLVLAAYHGTSATDPVATFARAAETTSRSIHLTPAAQVTGAGSWALSYWTHKDSVTDELGPPDGLAVRAAGTHTGAGRVTALLADTGAAVPTGGYGGQSATAAANSAAATMWTIVLAAG